MLKILILGASAALLAPVAWSAAPAPRRHRPDHLQLGQARGHSARVLPAPAGPGHPQCLGRARLCHGAPGARRAAVCRPHAAAVHRRGRADRSDHGDVHLADRARRPGAGAELPVRPRQHRQAAAQVPRQAGHGGTQRRRWQRGGSVTGTLLSSADGLVLRGTDGIDHRAARLFGAALSGTAGRTDHAPHAAVGYLRHRAAARSARASPTRPAASPGGRTTT